MMKMSFWDSANNWRLITSVDSAVKYRTADMWRIYTQRDTCHIQTQKLRCISEMNVSYCLTVIHHILVCRAMDHDTSAWLTGHSTFSVLRSDTCWQLRSLHSMAPPYLADELHRVADIDSRRRLTSASTSTLGVPPTRHSTIGDRTFPVAASRVWNSLPSSVTSSTSLSAFRRRLKQNFSRDVSAWTLFEIAVLCSIQIASYSIVKCSCSPRTLWHFNHTRL